MDDPTMLSRVQFAFTIAFHYLFPQFTMGLALLILVLKTLFLRRKEDIYNRSARFWGRIFAVTFVLGVVTGIPMEFQFGTNWGRFSAYAGDIIAQTLVWLGTWASGGFIIASNAWMQHPVGYSITVDGKLHLSNYWAVLFNPWIIPQYLHTMSAAVVTASFVMAGLGAYYLLAKQHVDYGRLFVTLGIIAGLVASGIQIWPSGDMEGSQVTQNQPVKLAAMEGLFQTQSGAGIVILGQPDPSNGTLDNPLIVPNALSVLTYRRWTAEVKGLDAFPADQHPDNIALLYYSYHIMVGLGTLFVVLMGLAVLLLWRRRLFGSRWMLWILMLATPFPFIANTAGWFTAELGRQPWIVFGLLRTVDGSSQLSAGNVLFTVLGFAGIYLLLGLLYVVLVLYEAQRGPEPKTESSDGEDDELAYA
jgi:cytochrome d ubiquinol oxidase subunit I